MESYLVIIAQHHYVDYWLIRSDCSQRSQVTVCLPLALHYLNQVCRLAQTNRWYQPTNCSQLVIRPTGQYALWPNISMMAMERVAKVVHDDSISLNPKLGEPRVMHLFLTTSCFCHVTTSQQLGRPWVPWNLSSMAP